MLIYLKYIALAVLGHICGRLDTMNDRHVDVPKYLSRLAFLSDLDYRCRPIDLFITLASNLYFIIVVITMIVTRLNTSFAEKYLTSVFGSLYALAAGISFIEEALNGSHNFVVRTLFFLFGILCIVIAILFILSSFLKKA